MHRVGLPFWRVYAVSVTDLNRRRRTDGMADGVSEEVGYRDKLLIKNHKLVPSFPPGHLKPLLRGPEPLPAELSEDGRRDARVGVGAAEED